MNQDIQYDAAVVGTGVAGLATALGLALQGCTTLLIGPRPRPYQPSERSPFDPRIYALAPGSARLLERLGVWGRVDPLRNCPVERMRVFGDAGDQLDFDAYSAAVERLATIVEEAELLRVLDSACDYQPLLQRIEQNFRSFRHDHAGVEVELSDGARIRTQLLVGADGAGSAVRAAAGIGTQIRPYRQTALVSNFVCEVPHLNTAWQWFTDEGIVALLPLPGQRVSLVWSAPDGLAPSLLALPAEVLGERVAARTNGTLGKLVPAGETHSFPLRLMAVQRLVDPGLALVGDAAHVVHPLAGQGLNLGLQDVDVLLQAVAGRESFRSTGDLTVLRRYERTRAEAVGLMRFATDGLARLFAAEDPFVRRARNTGMAAVNRLNLVKSRLVRQALG
jgi:2-polyprenylphenol 6-hydroxylase